MVLYCIHISFFTFYYIYFQVVNKWSTLTTKKSTETEEGGVQAGTGAGDLIDIPTPPASTSSEADDTKPPSITGPPTIV